MWTRRKSSHTDTPPRVPAPPAGSRPAHADGPHGTGRARRCRGAADVCGLLADRRPVAQRDTMRVPLTLIDFLERGALHGDRVAVVDEPNGPASLGELTHAELERRSRGMACELDRMGVGHGARIAIVSPNSARFVIALFGVSAFGRILVPINFRLNPHEVAYIVDHSGAPGAAGRPGPPGATRRRRRATQGGVGRQRRRRAVCGYRRGPGPLGARRGRDRVDQLHLRHDGATQRGPAHPPDALAPRGEHLLAPGGLTADGLPPGPAALSLQRMGAAVRADGNGCPAGDPAPCGRR